MVNTISGGPIMAAILRNSRKAYAREVLKLTGETPKRVKTEVVLSFNETDLEGVKFPYENLMTTR